MNPQNQDDCTSLDQGDIRFYDNYVPVIGVGDYIINVAQRINPANTTIDECYSAAQAFSVQGPRYTLPPEDLYSCFPPDNAAGIFDQLLPNVVLTKPELPWENNVFDDEDRARQTPWMALLLFVEGEDTLLAPSVAGWTTNRTMTASVTAASFYDTTNGVRTSRTQPDANGILWPGLEAVWYESDDFLQSTPCAVIDVSPAAFATLIPPKNDLQYLAHARQVDASAKDSTVLKVAGDGWYSVLVSNRLPDAPAAGSAQAGKRNIMHLVSLEGFGSYIGEDGISALPAGTNRVRMISLESWTFTCLPEAGESFSELMLGLLEDPQHNKKSTSFSLPVSTPPNAGDDAQYASAALQNGYVPMRYQTRLGEETFGWYRGPLSPVPVASFVNNADVDWAPFNTASSALIYDDTYGVFDLSYAVAWETGRLLALSNSLFGQELLDWQRQGHRLLDLIMERKSQIPALAGFDPNNPDAPTETSLLDQIEAYAVTDSFMSYLVTEFAGQIAPKAAGQTASPGTPMPAYPDMPSPPVNPQTIADLLQETDVQEAVRELGARELDTITDTLAQWYLLMGIPFENLVPNAALVPKESVRFFYIDTNWVDALIQGALSIGIESSRDLLYQDLMKDVVWNTMRSTVQQVRDQVLGTAANTIPAGTTTPLDQMAMTGMLLRSAAVSGYPGMEINAYTNYTVDPDGSARPDDTSKIKPLRLERLSSDVLLCIWPTVPAVVTMDEPHEGVTFGFEDPPEGKGEGCYLYLRSLATSNYGMPLCNDVQIEDGTCEYQIDAVGEQLIDPVTRVVKIAGLLTAMQNKLGTSVQIRDFAVQMIKVPEQAVFASRRTTPELSR